VSNLEAGLIGLGAMGRNHARVLAGLDGVSLSGVFDPALDGGGYGGVRGHASAEALLSSGLDCCVIAAPTSEHERLATIAAENGVSVLVEKPLAHDSAAARRMQRLFDEQGLVGVVGHIERFNPAIVALQNKISSDEVGDLYQLATRRQGPFPERIRDVGVVMDLATHDIDLTRWVTGSDYGALSAWTAHKSGRQHEDLVVATGLLRSGSVVSHHVNWLSAAKERLTVVTAEGGTLVADTLNADLYFYENAVTVTEWQAMAVFRGVGEGNMTRFALPRREPLVTELEAFRDAVRGDRAPAVPFSDGAEVVRIAELLLESAHAGATIDVALG
jgi:UDP-N-acetylglucosamine 3-dehydrogenase